MKKASATNWPKHTSRTFCGACGHHSVQWRIVCLCTLWEGYGAITLPWGERRAFLYVLRQITTKLRLTSGLQKNTSYRMGFTTVS